MKQPIDTSIGQCDLDQTWHALPVQDVAAHLKANTRTGLTEAESREHLTRYGPNRLTEEKREPFWKEFLEELREPMVLLLLVTGVLYAIWGELSDAVTIFLVILTLNTIEVVNEQRAKKAISALRKLAEPTSAILRAGQTVEVPAEQIVPGDVILLQAGRRVPADARLFEAYGLAVDESSLIGESIPVEKDASTTLETAAPLAERFNMVYTGTLVTRGRGSAVVVGTGMSTELGRIVGLARQVKEPRTPLQQAMSELSRWMVWLALGFSVLVPVLGVLIARQPLETMLLTGLSLAFATIPEEMPIIITMVLALGAYRLSKQRAIVKRLKAVETLGAVTVIATDKTGTLTENRMEVQALYPNQSRQEALTIGVLCNDANLDGGDFAGDPLETALLREGQRSGLDVAALRAAHPLCDEFTFDNNRKRMSVVRRRDGASWIAVKGAPESVLEVSSRRWTPDGDVQLSPERVRQVN
jgi:Ca2+-transporting ATPase